MCFQLLSIDGSREQLLDRDKKCDLRCFHPTFHCALVQREMERTSQNSFIQRCCPALWFQWLNHRSAATEPRVYHNILPSETLISSRTCNDITLDQLGAGQTKPISHILIKLAVAFFETPPMARRGDKDNLLQRVAGTFCSYRLFPLIIIASSSMSSSDHQNIQVEHQPFQ